MIYYSMGDPSHKVSFKEALFNGITPDRSLYFPTNISPLKGSFIQNLDNLSNEEIAYECVSQFVSSDITEDSVERIIKETINFDFPVKRIDDDISVLELFHGPTMAFKDVGARFTSRCLSYFISKEYHKKVTVLVATSGDTGAAVASGFYEVDGVDVFILYPSGKISEVKEKQISTYSKNIFAVEVDGTFDDCQKMVKDALVDDELTSKMNFTSANSINISRWIPQILYYFFAYKQVKNEYEKISFSVPSGNYGNIFSCMVSERLGLPINKFISGNNVNNPVERFLNSGKYNPRPSVHTISSAMDVGNPSNFIRVREFFNSEYQKIKQRLDSISFSDDDIREGIRELYNKFDYMCDPHGAVGYLGAREYTKNNRGLHCVFLETAHPAKFLEEMNRILSIEVEIPDQIQSVLNKNKKSTKIKNYSELKEYIIH